MLFYNLTYLSTSRTRTGVTIYITTCMYTVLFMSVHKLRAVAVTKRIKINVCKQTSIQNFFLLQYVIYHAVSLYKLFLVLYDAMLYV